MKRRQGGKGPKHGPNLQEMHVVAAVGVSGVPREHHAGLAITHHVFAEGQSTGLPTRLYKGHATDLQLAIGLVLPWPGVEPMPLAPYLEGIPPWESGSWGAGE
jgi:hypothetical protein